jgi:uncharacterized protein
MTKRPSFLTATAAALIFGCADYEPPPDLGGMGGVAGNAVGGAPNSGAGGIGGATNGGVAGTGGSVTAGTAGVQPMTGGAAGVGGSAGLGTAGTAGTDVSMGGMAGTEVTSGGAAGTGASPMGGMGGTGAEAGVGGSAGAPPAGPYAPRTGSFKVLAYFNTVGGFTHGAAIENGKSMLTAMGAKQGFEVTFSDNPADFGAQSLAQYELVFGLNPTGTSLDERAAERAAFEEWMTTKNGAFAGVHSSTDFMSSWAFWKEVTGQTYDKHDDCCTHQNIQWDPTAADFIAVVGLPSPWPRSEEWYKFKTWDQWSSKPGFKVLSKVTTSTDGGTRPVSYIREWSNFRSFYTSLGHEGTTYQDANFIRHVAAGIMWAVRREALFKP